MAKHKFLTPKTVDEILLSLGDPNDPVLNDADFRKLVAAAQKKIADQKMLKNFLKVALAVAKIGVKVFLK